MGLSGAHIVDCLVVYCSSWGPVVLGSNVHPALPSHGGVEGDPLNDPKPHVPHQPLVHSLLPVQGNHCRAVDSNWFGGGVCVKL